MTHVPDPLDELCFSDPPSSEYDDAHGVLHRCDSHGMWHHPDPARPVCRTRTCTGNLPVRRDSLPLIHVIGGGHTHDGIEVLRYKIVNLDTTTIRSPDVRARLIEFLRDLDWEYRYEHATNHATNHREEP